MSTMKNIGLKSFTEEDSLILLETLREMNRDVAMEIYKNGRRTLLYIPDHMNADKENWLMRKRNAVLYFGLSTLDLYEKCKGEESLLVHKYGLKKENYTLTPGSIPILIKGVGMVGALSITGLSPKEDHQLALKLFQRLGELKQVEGLLDEK